MATQMRCPNCQSPLTITPELHGQMVRCPPCGATLKVPMPKGKTRTATKRDAPAGQPAAPPPHHGGDVFDFHSPAAPPRQPPPAQGYPQQQAGSGPTDQMPRPWRRVRLGVLIFGAGVLVIFLAMWLGILVQEVKEDADVNAMSVRFFGLLMPAPMQFAPISEGESAEKATSAGAKWTFASVALLGALVLLIGAFMMRGVPRPSHAKGLISLTCFFIFAALVCVVIGMVVTEEDDPKKIFYADVLHNTGTTLFLAAAFAFLLFLFRIASHLNYASMRASVLGFGVYLITLPHLVKFITAMTIWSDDEKNVYGRELYLSVKPQELYEAAFVPSLVGIVLGFCWLLWLLLSFWSGIRRALIRGRL